MKNSSEYIRCEERSGLRSGRGNIHSGVKKNRGLAFQSRIGDRPEALSPVLCPVFMKSVTKKHPSVWGFFFFLDGSPIP